MKLIEKMKSMKFTVVVVIIAFLIGYLASGGQKTVPAGDAKLDHSKHAIEKKTEKETIWTCSMHPQIRMSKPGKCPICGMDLIPVTDDDGDNEGPAIISFSENAVKLADIQTTPVQRKVVAAEVRMVGKIAYDETKVKYITSRVAGRLDRLYVDYTGIQVKKGDHLVYIYSPQLVTAQQELIQAIETLKRLDNSKSSYVKETSKTSVDSAREKLRLWDISDKQIKEIEQKKKVTDHITIYSPISGIVIHKNAVEGKYVKVGEPIYKIADLSTVWAKLDAYESDIKWLRYGQKVEFTTEAYPGEIFKGLISFIDPVLDKKTRTVKVRVNIDNKHGKLKPEMFVRSVVKSRLVADGKVIDPELAGKWICPMHPEIVKDKPGVCDICGMKLVRAEELGYTVAVPDEEVPLVIPVSSVLNTGKRSVVYVKVPGKEKPTFEGKEITIGARAGDYYIVKSGLKEGDIVVTNGNFKIDSALQILAKPSMMNPEGGAPPPDHSHHSMEGSKMSMAKKPAELSSKFKKQLKPFYETYFKLQDLLAKDNFAGALEKSKHLNHLLAGADMSLLKGPAHMQWMTDLEDIENIHKNLLNSSDINEFRTGFVNLSEKAYAMAKYYGLGSVLNVYAYFCPMANNNKGANWLQDDDAGVRNPFYGKSMLGCGEIIEQIK